MWCNRTNVALFLSSLSDSDQVSLQFRSLCVSVSAPMSLRNIIGSRLLASYRHRADLGFAAVRGGSEHVPQINVWNRDTSASSFAKKSNGIVKGYACTSAFHQHSLRGLKGSCTMDIQAGSHTRKDRFCNNSARNQVGVTALVELFLRYPCLTLSACATMAKGVKT